MCCADCMCVPFDCELVYCVVASSRHRSDDGLIQPPPTCLSCVTSCFTSQMVRLSESPARRLFAEIGVEVGLESFTHFGATAVQFEMQNAIRSRIMFLDAMG